MTRKERFLAIVILISTFGFGLLCGFNDTWPIYPILVGLAPAEYIAPMISEEVAKGFTRKGIGGVLGGFLGLIGWSITH